MTTQHEARIQKTLTIADVSNIHGVSHDGSLVWFAHGDRGELLAVDPDSGERKHTLRVPADAGVTFDGECLWVAAGSVIRRIDRQTGEIRAQIASPAGEDTSGLAYHEGHLWVGSFREKTIFKVDAATGKVKRKLTSNRLVTGVTFRGAELWHGAVDRRRETPETEIHSELRRLDPESGEVTETRSLPAGVFVSGTEADASGRIWCGDPEQGKLRVAEW